MYSCKYTIDMQNEMDCLYHYNEFEYNHDFQLQTIP